MTETGGLLIITLLRVRALLGFSRVAQAMLSVAQPFAAALIALHGFPSADRLLLGLSAGLAGFMAVFALNDLLDLEMDRARFAHLRGYDAFDVDSAMIRHPLAQKQVSTPLGLAWIGGLGCYALVAAYLLSPPAAGLFLLAALLEIVYCKLAKVTPAKYLLAGAIVGVGALAGWVAMTPEIRAAEFGLVFVWMTAWEIGGRNIANDFADMEEDGHLGIRTVPLVHGPSAAARLAFVWLVATNLIAVALPLVSDLGPAYLVGAVAAGLYLLLLPGIRLLRSPAPQVALALFNRASLYPPVVLLALIADLFVLR